MAVTLLRNYGTYASGTVVTFADDTETALVTQGIATVATGVPTDTVPAIVGTASTPAVVGGNVSFMPSAGFAVSATPQGPRILPNGTILAFAALGGSAVTVAGTLYRCEIYVPHLATWTGIGILNGATAGGTDNGLVALYDSAGVLITNSAVAGAATSGVNAFQNRAFLNTVTLAPGRYFIGYQSNGTTDTIRTWAAANGGNQMCSSATGTFGTLPASFTAPTTFTAGAGPIGWLYQ